MEIDIRKSVEQAIDRIRIEDYNSTDYIVEFLVRNGKDFPLFEEYNSGESLRIISKEHALNIKKAIDKAIDLGWWD